MTSVLMAVLTRTVLQAAGKWVAEGDGIINTVGSEALKATAGLAHQILGTNFTKLRASTQKQLDSADLTPIDIAALAWLDILLELSDDTTQKATGKVALDVARKLDSAWFTDWLIENSTGVAAQAVEGWQPEPELVKCLADAISDALRIDSDEPLHDFSRSQLMAIPPRAREIVLQSSAVLLKRTHDASVSILRNVSGEASLSSFNEKLRRTAEVIALGRRMDVFGRATNKADGPPLLPLEKSYVEPTATWRKKKMPLLTAIDESLQVEGKISVLHAAFGFGKSLSVRTFASNVATKWLADSESNPFPLLIKCPDILGSHVGGLAPAIAATLEQMGFSSAELVHWQGIKKLIVLDGFDEVQLTDRERHGWLAEMLKLVRNKTFRLLCASRPTALGPQWYNSDETEVIAINEFDSAQIAEWLSKNGAALGCPELTADEVSRSVGELAGTPILLFMTAFGWKTQAATAPRTKTEIFKRFIDKTIRGKWAEVPARHGAIEKGHEILTRADGAGAFRQALTLVAWEYAKAELNTEMDSSGLSIQSIRRVLETRFPRLEPQDIAEVTQSMCLSMFLRRAEGVEAVTFSHRSFKEYLCAERLAELARVAIESHQFTAITAALADFFLGESEFFFVRDLLAEIPSTDRENLADFLLKDLAANRIALIESDDKVLTGRLLRLPMDADRTTMVVRNEEILSLALRAGKSINAISTASYGYRGGYRIEKPLSDRKYRVTTYFSSLNHSDIPDALGYDTCTGAPVALRGLSALELQKKASATFPHLVPAPTVIGKNYFAIPLPDDLDRLRLREQAGGGAIEEMYSMQLDELRKGGLVVAWGVLASDERIVYPFPLAVSEDSFFSAHELIGNLVLMHRFGIGDLPATDVRAVESLPSFRAASRMVLLSHIGMNISVHELQQSLVKFVEDVRRMILGRRELAERFK